MHKIEVLCKEKLVRERPRNIQEEDENLFSHEFEAHLNPVYIRFLNRINVFHYDLVNTKQFKFYNKYSHVVSPNKISQIKKVFYFFQKVEKIESAGWIIDDWSYGYFHWFSDVLPRWLIIKPWLNGSPILIPDYYRNYSFIEESISLLKIPVRYYNPRKRLLVESLKVASHVGITGNYHPKLISQLRNLFLKNLKGKPTRKIYISRAKSNKRKILNEKDVQNVIRNHNYEIHYFENYTLSEQIKIMSETKFLIGSHGSGLMNMLFMQKGGAILEQRRANDFHNNCFFSLASSLNHLYYYQLNKGDSNNTHVANLEVNLDHLKKNITRMEQDFM